MVEKSRFIHNSFIVKFKNNVNEKVLRRSLTSLIKVYPLLKSKLMPSHFSANVIDNNQPLPLFKSAKRYAPLSKEVREYPWSITYFKNELSFTMSHLLMDGIAFKEVFKTLIYLYCSYLTKKNYSSDNIIIKKRKGDAVDYLNHNLYSTKVKLKTINHPVLVVKYPKEKLEYAQVRFSYDDLMRIVKQYKSIRSIILSYLTLIAVKNIFPKSKLDYCITINTDMRRTLKIDNTLLNAIMEINLLLNHQSTNLKNIANNLKSLSEQFHHELKPEVTMARINKIINDNYKGLDIFPTLMLNYMADLNLNQFKKIICDIDFIESSPAKLNAFVYNNEVVLDLVFYEHSTKLMNAFKQILNYFKIKPISATIKKMEIEQYLGNYEPYINENKKIKGIFIPK